MSNAQKKFTFLHIPLGLWIIIWIFSLLWHILIFFFCSFIEVEALKVEEEEKIYTISIIAPPGKQTKKTHSQNQKQTTEESPQEKEEVKKVQSPQNTPQKTNFQEKNKQHDKELSSTTKKTNQKKSQKPVLGAGNKGSSSGLTAKNLAELFTAGGASSVYSLRNKKGRTKAAQKYGGSISSENSVERGLKWLNRHQDLNGRWDSANYQKHCRNKKSCWGRAHRPKYDPAINALAMLAFLGAGYTPKKGKYRKNLKKAQMYLLETQDNNGFFGGAEMYNHAIVLLALCESYALTQNLKLATPIRQAIYATAQVQQPGGGWSYQAQSTANRNDSSIVGWQILALVSAKRAGFSIPKKVLQRAWRHLQNMTDSLGKVRYANIGAHKTRLSNSLTAVGLLCSLLLKKENYSTITRQANILKENPPRWSERQSLDNCMYYWYHGTLAAFLTGGEVWKKWNGHMRDMLVLRQIKTGEASGSWEPKSRWASAGGRIYSTAINILNLEVYYRYNLSFVR